MEFELSNALGRYIIVEPAEKSQVLKADEISTVFKVISIGDLVEKKETSIPSHFLSKGDLIIVQSGTIERCMMGTKEIYYVRETDIIAKVDLRSIL